MSDYVGTVLFVNLIVFCTYGITFIFRKKWGISVGISFLTPFVLYNFLPKTIVNKAYWYIEVALRILAILYIGYYIYRSLKNSGSLKIIINGIFVKTTGLLILIWLCLYCLYYVGIVKHLERSIADSLFATFLVWVFAPIFETVCFHQICYSIIQDKPLSQYIILSVIFSIGITIAHLYLDWRSVYVFLFFLVFYFVRYFWKNEKLVYGIIIIHALNNIVCFVWGLMIK